MNGFAIKASERTDSIPFADAVFGIYGGDDDSPDDGKGAGCWQPEFGSEAESKSGT
jgi:hypothetical protein